MIRITWEWLGQAPALDLANTVAIRHGVEHDLVSSADEFERWARSEAQFLPDATIRQLAASRSELLDLRSAVRGLLDATASGGRPSPGVIRKLNGVTRRAAGWVELEGGASIRLRRRALGRDVDRVLAIFARSAMEVAVAEPRRLRRCSAPSCGMFYLGTRSGQRWCSTQCGTRARVARHYERHRRPARAGRGSDGHS